MSTEKKVIKHKVSVLELTEALDNVSAACCQRSVPHTMFTNTNIVFRLITWKVFARLFYYN